MWTCLMMVWYEIIHKPHMYILSITVAGQKRGRRGLRREWKWVFSLKRICISKCGSKDSQNINQKWKKKVLCYCTWKWYKYNTSNTTHVCTETIGRQIGCFVCNLCPLIMLWNRCTMAHSEQCSVNSYMYYCIRYKKGF